MFFFPDHRRQLTAPVITNPPNLRLAVDAAVMRMFVRIFKSPFGHRRHYADAAHQQEGGSASPLSLLLRPLPHRGYAPCQTTKEGPFRSTTKRPAPAFHCSSFLVAG